MKALMISSLLLTIGFTLTNDNVAQAGTDQSATGTEPGKVPVTVENFVRAESDHMLRVNMLFACTHLKKKY